MITLILEGTTKETGNTNQGEGQVRLAGTSVSVSVDVLSRADGKAINTDDYIIRIYSTDNNLLVKEYTRYRDMPEILTLNVGNYKIEALSHDVKPAEWEKLSIKEPRLLQ